MAIPIPTTIKYNIKTKDTDIALINVDVYYAVYCLKQAPVVAIFIRNIQY